LRGSFLKRYVGANTLSQALLNDTNVLQQEEEDYQFPLHLKQKNKPADGLSAGAVTEGAGIATPTLANGTGSTVS